MQILLAVIVDLFQFARTALFGSRADHIRLLPVDVPRIGPAAPLSSVRRTPQHNQAMEPKSPTFTESGVLYFIGVERALFHTDPVVAFDVVCGTIAYGEQVRLLKLGGRWAHVRYKDHIGWVFKDALREQARDVFPQFVPGLVYDADNEETKKLRLCIQDSFCGAMASLYVTEAEYVTYKLYRKQLFLPWTHERPRTPGTWQKKLRGASGVHIGIAPKTDSVMEYLVDDIGSLGYVEAVFPDDSITLSAIGMGKEGEYSEAMLSKEQWLELRPVFIEVN